MCNSDTELASPVANVAMRSGDRQVLIVGAGIGGMCLAAALTQRGIPWTIIERSSTLEPIGTGIALMPPALWIAGQLGVLEQLRLASAELVSTRRYRTDGSLQIEIPYPRIWGGHETRSIHRGELQRILRSVATGGEILLNCQATNVRSDSFGATVEFEGGSVSGCLAVGADGVRSTARKSVGEVGIRGLGQRIYRAHSATHGLVDTHTVFLGRAAVLGAVPLAQGSYIFANEITEESFVGDVNGRRERVRALFTHLTAPLARRLLHELPDDDDIHEGLAWEITAAPANWHKGNVVLLGDAVHATSPVLALGGALAMEDAWVLAEELHRQPAIEAALQAYTARRIPRVTWVQECTAAWVERMRSGTTPSDPTAEYLSAYSPLLKQP